MKPLTGLDELKELLDQREHLSVEQLQEMLLLLRGVADKQGVRIGDPARANPAELAAEQTAKRRYEYKYAAAPHLKLIAEEIRAFTDGERGDYRGLLVDLPPRHGKSETLSIWTPLWLLKRNPKTRIILASYGAEKAIEWGRKVRDFILDNPDFGIALNKGVLAASGWTTIQGGGMWTAGVGGPIGGRGADVVLVDDPYKDAAEAYSQVIREKIRTWFNSVALTRLEPAGFIVVVHCVAAGEPILMADGSWLPIEQVRPKMWVLAYEQGRFVGRRVTASRLAGHDSIIKVSTDKKSLRVNARHPFLLASGEWRKAIDLRIGDQVTVSNIGRGRGKEDPELVWFLGFLVGDGWVTSWIRKSWDKIRKKYYYSRSWCVNFALSVYPDLNERALAALTRFGKGAPKLTPFGTYRLDSNSAGRYFESLGLKPGCGAKGKRIPEWVFKLTPELKIAFLRGHADADGHVLKRGTDSYRISSVSRALIEDVRRLSISAGLRHGRICSFSQTVRAPNSKQASFYTCYSVSVNFSLPPDRYEAITGLDLAPPADVYDLTVEGAENFVAGGFVTHNTRWHELDLISELDRASQDGSGIRMKHITFPAIAEKPDELGRQPGDALWPERFSVARLEEIRRGMSPYEFGALYQQNPTPEEGASVRRTWWRFYSANEAEKHYDLADQVILSFDLALKETEMGSYNVGLVMARKGSITRILDFWRQRCDFPTAIAKARQWSLRYPRALAKIVEDKASGPALIATLSKEIPGFVPIPAHGSKLVRLNAVIPLIQAGNVELPHPDQIPWAKEVIEECAAFPNGQHDDIVDTLSHGLRYLYPSVWQHLDRLEREGAESQRDAEEWGAVADRRKAFTKHIRELKAQGADEEREGGGALIWQDPRRLLC